MPTSPKTNLIYVTNGHSYLVCPRLLEMDVRHGEHPSKWKPCRRGSSCLHNHEHEETLVDHEGHTVNDYYWVAGCRPHEPHEHPVCEGCGRKLVHADLDDLYDPKHLEGGDTNAEIPSSSQPD